MPTSRAGELQKNSDPDCKEVLAMPPQSSPSPPISPTDTSHACPICLDFISDQAFLDPCFHRFCFPCILQWFEMVAAHPPFDGDQCFECPVCKSRSICIIHNIVMETFQRYPLYCSRAAEKPFLMTHSHYRRLAFYKKNMRCEIPEVNTHRSRGIGVAGNSSLACWMQRELQALMQVEDVGIVAQHVIGLLEYFENRQSGRLGVDVTWNDAVLDAVRPFLFENAEKFCEELQSFLLSGLSVAEYDQWVEATVSTLPACQYI